MIVENASVNRRRNDQQNVCKVLEKHYPHETLKVIYPTFFVRACTFTCAALNIWDGVCKTKNIERVSWPIHHKFTWCFQADPTFLARRGAWRHLPPHTRLGSLKLTDYITTCTSISTTYEYRPPILHQWLITWLRSPSFSEGSESVCWLGACPWSKMCPHEV